MLLSTTVLSTYTCRNNREVGRRREFYKFLCTYVEDNQYRRYLSEDDFCDNAKALDIVLGRYFLEHQDCRNLTFFNQQQVFGVLNF